MFIKRLEIYGFKSFPYKVNIPFSPGITAIVGPNGSGKSNILDAIRWILGEQSPKRLRVKELSDLIFTGNIQKKIDFAEVKLIINHDPPVWEKFKDFPEIIITRRFYRNGEGEFFINQKPCRLKDIQFLFLDLGVNPQSYGIIEQGEVSKFLEISPKERKIFLEDLAGISKFKITEEETRKNLKKTKENLIRLQDIIKEVEAQYNHLKAQSEEAKRYLTLKDKLQNLLVKKNLYLWKNFSKEKAEIEEKINDLFNKKAKLEKEIEKLEIEEQKYYQELIKKEREIKDLKEEIQSKEKIYKDWENKFLNLLKEERNLKYKLEKEKIKEENEREKLIILNKELETIDASLKDFKEKAEKLKDKLIILKNEKENHLRIYEDKLNKFKLFEEEYINLTREKEKLLEKRSFLEKRINQLLKDKELTEKTFKNISKEWEKIQKEENIWDKIIEEKKKKRKISEEKIKNLSKIKEEVQEKLNQILLKKQKYISEIKSLDERLKLINKILPQTPKKSYVNKINLPSLESLIDLEKEDLNLLETVLKDDLNALVIDNLKSLKNLDIKDNLVLFLKKENLDEFFKIKKFETLSEKILQEYKNTPQFIYILKDKILFTPLGFIYFIKKPKKGIISLKKEKKELIKVKKELEKDLEKLLNVEKELEQNLKKYKQEINHLNQELENIKKEYENLIKQKENFKISLIKLEEQDKNLKEKLENFNQDFLNLNEEKSKVIKKLELLDKQLNENAKNYENVQKEKFNLEKILKELDKKLNNIYQEIIKIKTQNETFKNRKIEIQKNIEKIQNFLKNFKFSTDLILNDIEYVKTKIKQTKNKKELINQELEMLKKDLEKIQQEKENLEKELKKKEFERKNKEKELKHLDTQKYNLELKLTEIKLYLDNIKKELEELTDFNISSDLNEEILDINLEEIEKEIQNTKNILKNFQEVNLASIKEYEIISERYKNLLTQKEDLEKGIKELEGILENLKNLSKEKILDTLEKVNTKLKEIFPTIFPGGEAKLILTDNDPLSAGLDLNIKIPGKNIRHLNMLSGGEKALCVIAILISFYLVKPGPFCILDEVDASLDEKNSIQFIKLLQLIKKNSQIIIITHNPNIMKEVDTLLGVTMEEKGISKIFTIKLDQLVKEHQSYQNLIKPFQK